MLIRVFVNDTPGRKCSNILSHIETLKTTHSFDLPFNPSFDIEIRRKSELCSEQPSCSLPALPAIEIDGKMVFEGRDITLEELIHEITIREKIR